MSRPDDDLREELVLLRAAMARALRKQIDDGKATTPAWFEAARKFLSDQGVVLPKAPSGPPPAPALSHDLPFPTELEEME